jgi:BASS family bile acid:Na+ symporter
MPETRADAVDAGKKSFRDIDHGRLFGSLALSVMMHRLCTRFAAAFPLWIVLGCAWAWWRPADWTWFRPWIEPGLGLIMLGMGLTLRVADFLEVGKRPGAVAAGVVAQFVIMPASGWAIARGFNLEPGLALGLILVSCCPGGTASNVICYLAKANVALSVLMTMCSTFIAIGLTPLLTKWLAGKYLPIDALALFKSMLLVVLLPLVIGIAVNSAVGRLKRPEKVRQAVDLLGPVLSVAVIVLIVGCIFALKKAEIAAAAGTLFLSVFVLHASGFFFGYALMWLAGKDEPMRRTVSIEVGMQNSGLGSALATKHFAEYALAPVPSAISAVYHCIIGSLLAAWWRRSSK